MENQIQKTILQKLFDAQQEIGRVVKNAKNPHFNKTYADINAIVDAVEPILNKNGLMLIQPIEEGVVKTKIVNVESGETIESSMPLSMNGTPQAMGSQITYYRRYTLQSLLCLQVEDDDANQASTPPKATPQAKPQPTPQPKVAKKKVETEEQFNKVVAWALEKGKTADQCTESFDISEGQYLKLDEIINSQKAK